MPRHNVIWVHDPPPKAEQERLGIGGVVFTHGLGDDPLDLNGFDHSAVLLPGLLRVDRANYGYDGLGTIPPESKWYRAATRLCNWAKATPGLQVLVLGNETNMGWERAGYKTPDEEVITPARYIAYWKIVWSGMRRVRPDVQLAMAPIAPWNTDTSYPGNEAGDWLVYWADMFELAGAYRPDVVAVHTYTHGRHKDLVRSESPMDSPYEDRFYNWQHVRQQLAALPYWAQGLGVHITETNQDVPWSSSSTNGWWMEVAFEIQTMRIQGIDVRSAAAYCWPNRDGHGLVGNPGVQEDLRLAAAARITWDDDPQPPPNGGEMKEIFSTSMNEGFHDWENHGEVTVPNGSFPTWVQGPGDGVLHRPEYDAKDATIGHPEVLTKPYSAVLFTVYATMDGAIVFELPVSAGTEVVAEVGCMGVSHFANGKHGGLGMTIGISIDPIPAGPQAEGFFDTIGWKEWWSVDREDWKERDWETVRSSSVVATRNRVWVILFARARERADINAAHWDDLVVYADTDPDPDPDPGSAAALIRKSAAIMREQASLLDGIADVVSGEGVPRSPVEEAHALLTAALL